MELTEVRNANADLETLRTEVDELRERLMRLTEASISIFENADSDSVFQEVVNSA